MPITLDLQEKEFRFIEAFLLLLSFTLTILSEHFTQELLKFIAFAFIVILIGIHFHFKNLKDLHQKDQMKKIKDGVI